MVSRFQFRQDIVENWVKFNPVLLSGEPGIDKSSRRIKYGDGVHSWNDLPYSKIGSQFFNYYVSSNGNDTWDGDEGAPLKTLQKAVELAGQNYSYTCQLESPVVASESFIEVPVDILKVFVGDYFTTSAGYGFVVDITDGIALVCGCFTTVEVSSFTVSRRCTILCTGSLSLSERLDVPSFIEVVNEGFINANGGGFDLPEFAMFNFINRGSVYCQTTDCFIGSMVENPKLNVYVELGMSTGLSIVLDSVSLTVNDTLAPSECNVSGIFSSLCMSGLFTSLLDVVSDSTILSGNYSVSGIIDGSVSLNGFCTLTDDLTVGSENVMSVILCPVKQGDFQLHKVGIVKDLNL